MFKLCLKGLLTKFLAKFSICLKLSLCVNKDYNNKFLKSQVYKLCGSIKKSVIFSGKSCYFYIANILRTDDVVCIWLLIGQSQSVIVIVNRD